MAQMAALLRHYLQENGLNDPALGDAIPFSRIVVVTSWPEKVFHTLGQVFAEGYRIAP